MKERDIEQYFKKQIEEAGGLCLKFTSPGTAGVPDRVVVIGGRVSFAEFKRPGRKTTDLQCAVINRMRKCGASVDIIDSMAAAKEVAERKIDLFGKKGGAAGESGSA